MKYQHLFVFLSLLLMGCKPNPGASKKAKTHLFSYIEHQFESPIMGERRTIKVFLPFPFSLVSFVVDVIF